MNKIGNRILLCFLVSVLFVSCTLRKKMIYFQDDLNGLETSKNYNPVFHTDDILSITVMGMDPETVKPFNLPISNSLQTNSASPSGYLVDSEGNIDFPIIGKIKVAGLSRGVVIDTLKNKLKPYLTSPSILIRILNFKVTVLGEVHFPGTFTIPNERITLPEAIGLSGDLLISGKRRNVLVIRDEQGIKTKYIVDLTSKQLFTSPVYYLNQNDVVYVEPNQTRLNSTAINPQNAALMVTVITFILTIMINLRIK